MNLGIHFMENAVGALLMLSYYYNIMQRYAVHLKEILQSKMSIMWKKYLLSFLQEYHACLIQLNKYQNVS